MTNNNQPNPLYESFVINDKRKIVDLINNYLFIYQKVLDQKKIDTLADQIFNSQLKELSNGRNSLMDNRREFLINNFEGGVDKNPLKAWILRVADYRTRSNYLLNQFESPEIIFKKTDEDIKQKANSSTEYRIEYEKAESEQEKKAVMMKYNIIFTKELAEYVRSQYQLYEATCNKELDEKIIPMYELQQRIPSPDELNKIRDEIKSSFYYHQECLDYCDKQVQELSINNINKQIIELLSTLVNLKIQYYQIKNLPYNPEADRNQMAQEEIVYRQNNQLEIYVQDLMYKIHLYELRIKILTTVPNIITTMYNDNYPIKLSTTELGSIIMPLLAKYEEFKSWEDVTTDLTNIQKNVINIKQKFLSDVDTFLRSEPIDGDFRSREDVIRYFEKNGYHTTEDITNGWKRLIVLRQAIEQRKQEKIQKKLQEQEIQKQQEAAIEMKKIAMEYNERQKQRNEEQLIQERKEYLDYQIEDEIQNYQEMLDFVNSEVRQKFNNSLPENFYFNTEVIINEIREKKNQFEPSELLKNIRNMTKSVKPVMIKKLLSHIYSFYNIEVSEEMINTNYNRIFSNFHLNNSNRNNDLSNAIERINAERSTYLLKDYSQIISKLLNSKKKYCSNTNQPFNENEFFNDLYSNYIFNHSNINEAIPVLQKLQEELDKTNVLGFREFIKKQIIEIYDKSELKFNDEIINQTLNQVFNENGNEIDEETVQSNVNSLKATFEGQKVFVIDLIDRILNNMRDISDFNNRKDFDRENAYNQLKEKHWTNKSNWDDVSRELLPLLERMRKERASYEKAYYEKTVKNYYLSKNLQPSPEKYSEIIDKLITNEINLKNVELMIEGEYNNFNHIKENKGKVVFDIFNKVLTLQQLTNTKDIADINVIMGNLNKCQTEEQLNEHVNYAKQFLNDNINNCRVYYYNMLKDFYSKNGRFITEEEIKNTVDKIVNEKEVDQIKLQIDKLISKVQIENGQLKERVNSVINVHKEISKINNEPIDENLLFNSIWEQNVKNVTFDNAISNLNKLENELKTKFLDFDYNKKLSEFKEQYIKINKSEDGFMKLIDSNKSNEDNLKHIQSYITELIRQNTNEQTAVKSLINNIFMRLYNSSPPEFVDKYYEVLMSKFDYNKCVQYLNKILPDIDVLANNYSKWNMFMIEDQRSINDLPNSNWKLSELINKWKKIHSKQFEIAKYGSFYISELMNNREYDNEDTLKRTLHQLHKNEKIKRQNELFVNEFNKYKTNVKEVDDDLFKEVVGHCNSAEDIKEYMEARTYIINSKKPLETLVDKSNFDSFYLKHKSENPDLNSLTRTFKIALEKDSPNFDDKVLNNERRLVTFTNGKYNIDMLRRIKEENNWNTNEYITYLDGELLYLQYVDYLYPSDPQTFLEYYQSKNNWSILKSFNTIYRNLSKLVEIEKSLNRPDINKLIKQYNEIEINESKRLTLRRLCNLYQTPNIEEITNRLSNLIKEKNNSLSTNTQLEQIIKNSWLPYFPNDPRSVSDWSRSFGSNYKAKSAIEKLGKNYRFYLMLNPDKPFDLRKFVAENEDSIDKSKIFLDDFYKRNFDNYNKWLNNTELRILIEEVGHDFGNDLDSSRNQLYSKFNGNLRNCILFLKGRKSVVKYNKLMKNSQINELDFDSAYSNSQDKEKFLNDMIEKTSQVESNNTKWENNADFKKGFYLFKLLPNDDTLNLPNDYLTYSDEQMYNNVLIPIAKKYYEYKTNDIYKEEFDSSLDNSHKFRKILRDVDDKLKNDSNWNQTNIPLFINQAENIIGSRLNINEKELREKYNSDPQKARDHIEYLVKLKQLMKLKGINGTDLPSNQEYQEYHNNCKDIKSKIQYLDNKINEFNQNLTTSWHSAEFSKIHREFITACPDDKRINLEECMKHYNFNYPFAKIELQLDTAKSNYRNNFNAEYVSNNKEGISLINEINSKNKLYESMAKDSYLNTLLAEYNLRSNEELKISDLALKFDNINVCKNNLNHDILVKKIEELTHEKFNDDYPITIEGNRDLQNYYEELTRNSNCFESNEFNTLLAQYNSTLNTNYDVNSIKNKYHNDYIDAFNSLKIDIIENQLKTQYNLSEKDLSSLVDKDKNKYRLNLEVKLNQVGRSLKDVLNNFPLQEFYRRYQIYTNSTMSLEDFVKENNYDMEKIKYLLYSTDWSNKTGKVLDKSLSNKDYKAINDQLYQKINAYDVRKGVFIFDSKLNQLLNNVNDESLDSLLKKYEDSLSPNQDLLEARNYLEKKISIEEYRNFLLKVGDKDPVDFSKMNDTDVIKYVNKKKEEYFQYQRLYESKQIVELKNRYNHYYGLTYNEWTDLYKKFKDNKDNICQETLDFENLKYEYNTTFGKKYVDSGTSKQSQIEKLRKILTNYTTFYHNRSDFNIALSNYNSEFSMQQQKTIPEIVEKFGSNVINAINFLTYEYGKSRLKHAYGEDYANKLNQSNEGIDEINDKINDLERNKKKFDENKDKINSIIDDWNKQFSNWNKMDVNRLKRDWKNNYYDAINWARTLTMKQELFNLYGVNYNQKQLESEYQNSNNAYNSIKKETDNANSQFNLLNKLDDNINQLVKNYNTKNHNNLDLGHIFGKNNCDAYQTYLDLLINKYNDLTGKDEKTIDDYNGKNYRRCCEDINKEIEKIEKIKDYLNKTDQKKWNELSNAEKDEILQNYQSEEEGLLRMKINDELKKYKQKNNNNAFQLNEKIRQYNREGRDINEIYNYLVTVNQYSFDTKLKDAISKYNSENNNQITDDYKEKFDNAYEVWKFIKLEPLRIRFENAFKRQISLDQLMDDDLPIEFNKKKSNFDLDRIEFITKARVLLKENINNNVISNQSLEEFITTNDIKNENELNEKMKKWNDDVNKSNEEKDAELAASLVSLNKNIKDDNNHLTKEDLNKLSNNVDDIKIINEILANLYDYERHFNVKISPDKLSSLLDNINKPNWSKAYLKVKLLPLLDDHNEMSKKERKIHRENLIDIIKRHSKSKNKDNWTVEEINEMYDLYKNEVIEEKKKYLEKYFNNYLTNAEKSETIDQFLEEHPDLIEAEKYLRLMALITPLNKKYRELKDNYKKTFAEINYENEYGSKNIDNLQTIENQLLNKTREAENIWNIEKAKDDEIKNKKSKVDDKLREVNRIRRRLNLQEINPDRFNNMSIENASNEIADLLEDARMKESEKNRVNNVNTGSYNAPLRTQMMSNPINNNINKPINSTTNSTEPVKNSIVDNYEGGIAALISKSSKGISIRQLLLDQQMKNKMNNNQKTNYFNTLEPNLGKPTLENSNNLFSSKPMTENSSLKPISEQFPTTERSINRPKFLNTPIDEKEIIKTHNMTQIIPKRARKNAPLRFKYSNNSLTKISNNSTSTNESTKLDSFRKKVNSIKVDDDIQIEKTKEKTTFDKEDISLVELKPNKKKTTLRFKKTSSKNKSSNPSKVTVVNKNVENNIELQSIKPQINQQPIISNNEIPNTIKDNPELMRYFNMYNNSQ